ncbi:MAG: DUF4288 domain-containing protein [Bacteriovoracaceae bacterium]|nr:DUF4288 domain-containing protein [Bacteriovoracaceae bacterium]
MVEHSDNNRYMDSTYIFKATCFDDAFNKALKIGRNLEHRYENIEKNEVHVKFKEIVTLDYIGKINDGCEVVCDRIDIPKNTNENHDTKYFPEKSRPSQTL